MEMSELQNILDQRRQQHGDFNVHASITQQMKSVMFAVSRYHMLSPIQQEALEMIVHKIGRILAGNPDHVDHWDDIAGYATLVANDLRKASDDETSTW